MERIFKKLVGLAALGLALPTFADTIMVPPPEYPPLSAQAYPESRFGSPPEQQREMGPRRSPASTGAADGEQFHYQSQALSHAQRSPNGMFDPGKQELPSFRYGVQEVSVIAGDLGYFPKTVFVTRSIPVKLYVTSTSSKTLCIIMDSFNVRKQVSSKEIEEINFTPNYPGKYKFHCPVNGMEGTLVVRDMSSTVGYR